MKKEEEVEVDETLSIRFEDPIPAKRIKREPVEGRKASMEVATQTEALETDVEVLKAEIQNLKQRVDSGFKEADERMARIQETIEKSDGLNSQQAVLVKSKVTSKVDKSQPEPNNAKKTKSSQNRSGTGNYGIYGNYFKFRDSLRGAAHHALEELKVRPGDSMYKPCFKKLFEICKIYFKKNGFGTKEVLAEVAKDHAKQVYNTVLNQQISQLSQNPNIVWTHQI